MLELAKISNHEFSKAKLYKPTSRNCSNFMGPYNTTSQGNTYAHPKNHGSHLSFKIYSDLVHKLFNPLFQQSPTKPPHLALPTQKSELDSYRCES